MEFRNKIPESESEKISYFTALSLIFSYAELFIPRIIPFLKIFSCSVINSASFPSFHSDTHNTLN